jgi:hypothetical protein
MEFLYEPLAVNNEMVYKFVKEIEDTEGQKINHNIAR